MPVLPYYYARALEIEGRHPSDAGSWIVTIARLEVGEGLPRFDTPWAQVTFPEGDPIAATHRPPSQVLWRNFYYRRIRSSAECDRHMLLDPEGQPRLAFHLTADWANPPGVLIPVPSVADRPIPHTHASVLIHRIPDRQLFHFRLKWSDWGDRGTGYMPYEYFDRYVFECWATYGHEGVLRQFQFKKLDEDGRIRWSARDEEDHRIYAFEVRDRRCVERRAWTFVIERDGALEIEEMYVRPEYRGQGHGSWMADRVVELSRVKKLPLRMWVAFADCKAENESNYPGLVATANRLGVEFQACPVPWAAYFATNERPGEPLPVEPDAVPDRPRAPRNAVRAFVMGLGVVQGEAALNDVPSIINPAQEPVVSTSQHLSSIVRDESPAVNSPEWGAMNERRAELILKDLDKGLTEAERDEYERLQELSLRSATRAFPRPTLDFAELAKLREELRTVQSRTE